MIQFYESDLNTLKPLDCKVVGGGTINLATLFARSELILAFSVTNLAFNPIKMSSSLKLFPDQRTLGQAISYLKILTKPTALNELGNLIIETKSQTAITIYQ